VIKSPCRITLASVLCVTARIAQREQQDSAQNAASFLACIDSASGGTILCQSNPERKLGI
jgi:hypothetical protein